MDITKFCATTDPRAYMHKPMRHDGYLYATTGHIAVRIADDPAIEAGPMPQNLQNGILQKMAYDTEERAWQPVPVIDKANLRDCAKDGLLSKRRDDVTGQPGYTLTAEGRRRLAEGPGSKQGSNMKRGDSEGGETDVKAQSAEIPPPVTPRIPPPQYDPDEVAFKKTGEVDVIRTLADARLRELVQAAEILAPCVPGAIDTSDMELIEIAEAVSGHVADLALKLGRSIAANEAMQEEIESLREMNVKLDAALQKARAPDFVLAPPAFDRVTAAVHSKYHREIKPGVFVDVYDVLHAWAVINPALQHLVKKALQPGERGHKTMAEDLNDIIASANRAAELEQAA